MFDFDGNALPLLNVFNLVRPENGGATVAPQVVEVDLIVAQIHTQLPQSIPAAQRTMQRIQGSRMVILPGSLRGM